ncbi:MAG: phospholipase, partial [Burkholderiales bacterium]|nr:phospholipase [Burkholderiales bacterium]
MTRHSTGALTIVAAATFSLFAGSQAIAGDHDEGAASKTATPIKHFVVIYNENVSFDHYFATYPNATNPEGEPRFRARPGTPQVNNLARANLLANNPNATNPANGSGAAEPFRLDRTQAATADQNHAYTPEQKAYDNGAMDLFPLYTGT